MKHAQNWKGPLFQREEDGLFTFHLMVRGELKVKQWIPPGKNRDVSYVTRNMWKYRRNFIESFGLNAT